MKKILFFIVLGIFFVTSSARAEKILFIGDSLMEALGPELAKVLPSKKHTDFIQAGKRSTGLCRPDFYDWEAVLTSLMKKYSPETVYISFGTNDNQSAMGRGQKPLKYASNTWDKEYIERISRINAIILKNGGKPVWIGMPIMKDKMLRLQTTYIRGLIKEACNSQGVLFIEAACFSKDEFGEYIDISMINGRRTKIRTNDGVHLTTAGAKLWAEEIFREINSNK